MADPFADRHANPFADPSVQGALGSSRTYDDDVDDASSAYKGAWDASTPATEADTPYGGSGSSSRPPAGGREDDLARRERELEQRERDLQQRADHIQKHGRNNWPFFYPMIYHDIKAEIPPDYQQVVLHLYSLWLIFVGTLVINMAGCIFLLIQGSNDGIKDMIAAIVYFPVLSVASFLLWYRPAYNGFMKEHSLFYYTFFIFGGCHIAYSVYIFLGIPSTGSDGLLNMIQSWSSGRVVAAILGIFVTLGFAVQGLGILWYYREIWKHNHEQGHTFAQAKSELATRGALAYFTRGNQV
ncbi:scamp-domain-containing protein [Jaminaea rosea]|uniref:Scamp-domain-containing protein n=1 Tax=Jaminaea rosea TaxID=1569628 RepID=A0A316V197_9BASI|nr:scamp-domain-containing protein [Jaminaea rosea]PWN29953.1 scamp-domain-containing protein [Jaminaea rosea]